MRIMKYKQIWSSALIIVSVVCIGVSVSHYSRIGKNQILVGDSFNMDSSSDVTTSPRSSNSVTVSTTEASPIVLTELTETTTTKKVVTTTPSKTTTTQKPSTTAETPKDTTTQPVANITTKPTTTVTTPVQSEVTTTTTYDNPINNSSIRDKILAGGGGVNMGSGTFGVEGDTLSGNIVGH